MRKNRLLWVFCLIVAATLTLALAACQEPDPGDTTPAKTYTVTLDKQTVSLEVLERDTLTAEVKEDGAALSGAAVIWTSSDSTVAAVTAGGGVTALKEGTATVTAAYSGVSATATVTVEYNGARPTLVFGGSDEGFTTGIKVGAPHTLTPQVRFKSQPVSDSDRGITYSYASADTAVASVSADGAVTPLKYGTTAITVTANYPDATAANVADGLTQALTLKVIDDYTFEIDFDDGFDSDIYLQATGSFKTDTRLVAPTATFNGADVSGNIVWTVSDTDVAQINNGVITLKAAAKAGDTFDAGYKYVTLDQEYVSEQLITITVRRATVSAADAAERVDKDLSVDNLAVSGTELPEAITVIEVYDALDESKENFWADGKLDKTLIPAERLGERTWVVVGDRIAYELKVTVITKIIYTWADHAAIFESGLYAPAPVWDGYYVLGADVDATGITVRPKPYANTDGTFLVGIYNGRGHYIDGLTIGDYGLFGLVSGTAQIQNLGLTNVTLSGTSPTVIAYSVRGVSNDTAAGINGLFVTIKDWSQAGTVEGRPNTTSNPCAGLMYQCDDAVRLQSVVVILSSAVHPSTGAFGVLVAATNKGAWRSTDVISDYRMFATGDAANDTYAQASYYGRFESVNLYAAAYTSDPKLINSSLPTAYFNRTTLAFASTYELFKTELQGISESAITVTAGTPAVKVSDNARVFSYEAVGLPEANKAHISFDGGFIKGLDTLPLANGPVSFTLKVTYAENARRAGLANATETLITKSIPVTVNPVSVREYELTPFTYLGNDPSCTAGITVPNAYFAGKEDTGVRVDFMFPAKAATDTVERYTANAVITGGALVISNADIVANLTKIGSGACIIQAVVDGVTYKFSGITFRWAISDVASYNAMQYHLVGVSNGYYGDFYMLEDIDLTGYNYNILENYYFVSDGADTAAQKAFQGVFDGQKYAFLNPTLNRANLGIVVGGIGSAGVVRNVRIINYTFTAVGSGGGIAAHSRGRVENCYVSGKVTATLAESSTFSNFGAGLVVGRVLASGSKMNNCIGEFTADSSACQVAVSVARCGSGATEANTFTNCLSVNASGLAWQFFSSGVTNNALNVRYDFTVDAYGNNNFATLSALFDDQAAAAIAAACGVADPAA
jgi:hypothetical protein